MKASTARELGRRGVLRHLVGLTSAGRHFQHEPTAIRATEAAAEALFVLCSAHHSNIEASIKALVTQSEKTTKALLILLSCALFLLLLFSLLSPQARAIHSLSESIIHWTSSKAAMW